MELSIAEQLSIIAQSAEGEFRLWLMYVCLAALGIGFALVSLYAFRSGLSRLCRLIKFLGPVGVIMAGPFIVKMVSYGSNKPPQPTHLWRFEFQNGLHDIGSYCTNDTIHAEWDYAPAYESYTLKAKYRDLTITNEVGVCIDVWHDMEDVPVSLMFAEWYVPNATNMSVVCYADYVPPPHVVTNGVYHMEGVSRSMATTNSPAPDFVTWGIRVEVVLPNGAIKVITPTNRPPDPIFLMNNMNNQGEANE